MTCFPLFIYLQPVSFLKSLHPLQCFQLIPRQQPGYSAIYPTVCSYHVTYVFQSEYTLYCCLNVKELVAQNRCEIGSLSDCNETRTHNHLVPKGTLNHLVFLQKLSGCRFESHCSHINHLYCHIYVFTVYLYLGILSLFSY